ncbi:MAG TPA: OmpA family protein [Bryobacteraceae bacterium]|nr:OmpA family protein [Bryobacteraceae bacterium]
MRAVKLTLSIVAAAAALYAQAPSPVQTNVSETADGHVPIFKVQVTSRTIRAVNYHHRRGTTKIEFRGTALMPEARGEAEVTPNDGATRINLKFNHLSNPVQYGREYLTLVLWAITPEGRPERLGEVTLRDADQKNAELYATTDLASFGMIVTAEPYFNVSQPSDVVVMENVQGKDTTGTMEDVDAKYELLKRGTYSANVSGTGVTEATADTSVPLQLREARLAMTIAKAQGASKYAPDTMQKAEDDMVNAEGFAKTKDLKRLETSAREATQMAEDARRISIQKEQEETERAMKQRESDARAQALASDAKATEAQQRAEEEARLRATAQAEAAAADAKKREAEAEMASAKQAQAQAEAAKAEALAEQQRLAAAKAAAESSKDQAEKDAQALRVRLKDQLNLILQTRDSARGLIVNMSDVLFDVNQATLKPGAKEKLAKVSGILLAYPSLHLTVEGHTDSTGSDDYNQKLSERRADSVLEYLVSNGIATNNIEAHGYGKTRPVASNDTAAGRQQNRRVELVVNGDVIGQPVSDTAPAPSGIAYK